MNPILSTPIGGELHGVQITEHDQEIERSIKCYDELARLADEADDEDGARLWSGEMLKTIMKRRPDVVAAWEREEVRRLDEGLGYFGSEAAQELGRARVA
jgi:hypothetical protein